MFTEIFGWLQDLESFAAVYWTIVVIIILYIIFDKQLIALEDRIVAKIDVYKHNKHKNRSNKKHMNKKV